MSSQHGDGSVVSPLSAGTAQPSSLVHNDPESNAPEVVDISMSPYHHQQSPSGASATIAASSPRTVYSTTYPEAVAGQYNSDQGKEVIHYDEDGKIALSAEDYAHYPQAMSDLHAKDDAGKGGAGAAAAGEAAGAGASKGKKILGMRRTVFFIVLAVVCIAIAVAVGAGVGATMSNKSKSSGDGKTTPSGDSGSGSSSSSSVPSGPSSQGASSTSSGSSPPGSSSSASPPKSSGSKTSSSSSSSSSTSSATPTPTFLNQTKFPNGQGWGFQGFSDADFAGDYTNVFLNDADFVETERGTNFKIGVSSFQWMQRDTNCCVSFCSNDTQAGWLGYQCQSKKQPKTSDIFTRVWVWCRDDHQRSNARRCGPS